MTDIPRDPVPMKFWGKDHWSTFAYMDTRCVDYIGVPNAEHLRVDGDRHPAFANGAWRSTGGKKYPTLLKGGKRLADHDDWDCIDDLIAAGLLEWEGTDIHPVFKRTPKGRRYADLVREHKVNKGRFANFNPPIEIEKMDITHVGVTAHGLGLGGTVK